MESGISPCDWNHVWNRRLKKHLEVHGLGNPSDYWDSREEALEYWKGFRVNRQSWLEETLRTLPLKTDSRVLDIGSGPGNLAVSLASRAGHVTAIEPAKGMRKVLDEKRREYGLGNITCIPKHWEEVDFKADLDAPYDLVIAAFSLTMFDIRDALHKMNEVACGGVFVDWFMDEPGWEAESRWLMPLLRGEGYTPLPKCDILLPIIEELGISPRTQSYSFVHTETFTSMEDAVKHYSRYYGADDQRSRDILTRYLRDHLQSDVAGFRHSMPADCLRMSWTR
jgi:SAM-dependent methyltransferase